MNLSIRTKVLATYTLLALLVIAIMVTGLTRLNRIGSHLNVIQSGYLPIVKTLNSFVSFYHLDESFDVQKIVANRSNRLFIESTTVANPQLFQTGLRKAVEDARKVLQSNINPSEAQQLNRINEIAEHVIQEHAEYIAVIRSILKEAPGADPNQTKGLDEKLQNQKRRVRLSIDFLSKQLDTRIRNAMTATVLEERKAVFWTIGLTFATVGLAVLVGLIALLSLRPLATLKAAARQIAQGDLQRRVSISSSDEIGDLAREFNTMADSIQQRDEALRLQQDQLILAERMAVVGRMASKISHEVRNPLNALGLNVELLEDEVQTENAKKVLKALSNEIDRLNRVAENYLSMSRSQKQDSEDTDLKHLVSNLEAFIRPECEKRRLKLKVEIDSNLPNVKTDPIRIEQALLNLLRNSMEAMVEGKSFGLKAQKENGAVVLEIWDEGAGIPKEVLPHIFEPFYTTKDKGTGLGLAIAHEIIRDQGGSIECQSEVGRGTRFRVQIPLVTG